MTSRQPVEFIAPVIQAVVTKLKALQPQKTESQAIRRVQALEAQLKAAQDQLAAAGLAEETQRPPSSPKPNPKRSPCSAPLGSTPKRKARKIEETSQQKRSVRSIWGFERAVLGFENGKGRICEYAWIL